MRNYEGTTRLQEIGIVEGIRAINVRVGDKRVFNGGYQSEIIRVEVSKTGKSVKLTTKWFDKMSKYENGQWVGEWKEDTRNMRADTIVVIAELNPSEEIEAVEVKTVEAAAAKEVKELIANVANMEPETAIEECKALLNILDKIIPDLKETARHQLRDLENELKWVYSSLCEMVEEKKKAEDKAEVIKKVAAGFNNLAVEFENNKKFTHEQITQMVLTLTENLGTDLYDELYKSYPDTLRFITQPIKRMLDKLPNVNTREKGIIGTIVYNPMFKMSYNKVLRIAECEIEPFINLNYEVWQLILLIINNRNLKVEFAAEMAPDVNEILQGTNSLGGHLNATRRPHNRIKIMNTRIVLCKGQNSGKFGIIVGKAATGIKAIIEGISGPLILQRNDFKILPQ